MGTPFVKSALGWHVGTHHRNGKQEHFLPCVILQGKTVIWVF
jgi:hypothetical protein